MKNFVIVSGGSGFIGLHLVEYLRSIGKKVLVLDKRPPRKLMDDVLFECTDLSDPNWRYFGDKPEVLYHLAAEPWTLVKGDSWFNESDYVFRNNAVATYNVLKETKPEFVVFSSSSNVYSSGRKFTEDSPIVITSQYGYSKFIGEQIIRKSGIPYCIFRFGAVVGPRGRDFPNRLVWCATKGEEVELFNNGKSYRDIIDVEDVVETLGFSGNFNKLQDNTYNLAMGIEVTNMQMAIMTQAEAMRRGLEFNYKLTPFVAPGYSPESTLSIERIQKLYNWKPSISHYMMFKRMFDYYLNDPSPIEPPSWGAI